MADIGIIDQDTGVMVEKLGRGYPRGSKNKPKAILMAVSSSSAPMKRRPGRPLGSKNKPKPSSSLVSTPLDVDVARHNTLSPPSGNTFSFLAIAGARYLEQQRVPLKFNAFMDGRELCEAILWEESGGGTPYEVEVYYDGNGEMYFRGGWPCFAEDRDLQ
jgi:hypothetical protein